MKSTKASNAVDARRLVPAPLDDRAHVREDVIEAAMEAAVAGIGTVDEIAIDVGAAVVTARDRDRVRLRVIDADAVEVALATRLVTETLPETCCSKCVSVNVARRRRSDVTTLHDQPATRVRCR